MGRFEKAITAFQEDLASCRELGNRHGEAGTLNNLGLALQDAGRMEDTITAHQHAAAIYVRPATATTMSFLVHSIGLSDLRR